VTRSKEVAAKAHHEEIVKEERDNTMLTSLFLTTLISSYAIISINSRRVRLTFDTDVSLCETKHEEGKGGRENVEGVNGLFCSQLERRAPYIAAGGESGCQAGLTLCTFCFNFSLMAT
jgi:hypothetical protein